jgi:hypothetical protein
LFIPPSESARPYDIIESEDAGIGGAKYDGTGIFDGRIGNGASKLRT